MELATCEEDLKLSTHLADTNIPPPPISRPVSWQVLDSDNSGFSHKADVKINEESVGTGVIRVYKSIFTESTDPCKEQAFSEVSILFIHGAGATSYSFLEVVDSLPSVLRSTLQRGQALRLNCYALDLPGHGASQVADEKNLPMQRLRHYVTQTINALFPKENGNLVHLVLCGHSLGGAVVVGVGSKHTHLEGKTNMVASSSCALAGVIILDIVEGTALQSLDRAQEVISSRKSQFATVSEAVRYVRDSGAVNNLESAKRSVPDQLAKVPLPAPGQPPFKWRTDLAALLPFVHDWFAGLSDMFLSLPCRPKLVILAGTDRLDTPMACGHMQGKFQLVVLPQVSIGHHVQEDAPKETSQILVSFLVRNFLHKHRFL